jgi:membrane protein
MTRVGRFIVTIPPVAFVIRKSKKISLPGFEGIPLYDVISFFFQQTKTHGFTERAAAIAFNFLMAIPPLCIFFFTLLSHLPGAKNLYREFLNLAKQFTPNQNTYVLVKDLVDDFFRPGSALISTGLILALFFSSNAMMMIQRTFNRSMHYIPVKKKNFLEIRWNAIRLTLIIIMLLLVTTLVMLTQGALLKLLFRWLEVKSETVKLLIRSLRIIISIFLVFYGTAFIYRFGPSLHKRWNIRSPGAILATTLIISATFLFSYWVNNFASYNKVYGSIGSVIILMLLVYINSLVLLIGFELNVSINSLKEIAARREADEKK